MNADNRITVKSIRIDIFIIALILFWSGCVALSLCWSISQHKKESIEVARHTARMAYDKDVLYRRWNAHNGGVYGLASKRTPPNPYLKVKERDIKTPSGKDLTLINPAYMTRQVHEMQWRSSGIQGHITSLKPIRPQNAADPWEKKALKAFEGGVKEVSEHMRWKGEVYLRLMRPLPVEKSCLKCHGQQGYKLGDVRGGIGIAMPMAKLNHIDHAHMVRMSWIHGSFWLLGLMGIIFGAWRIKIQIAQRREIEEKREALIAKLEDALNDVKTLTGLIPICASCKKIRNDSGYWEQIESYIHQHSGADFSHGICPDCLEKLYPKNQDLTK